MNHIDCKYYLAVDVFKGMCKRTKVKINADEASCSEFAKAAKCKHCIQFTQTEDYLGLCMAKVAVNSEMFSVTCKDFKWI